MVDTELIADLKTKCSWCNECESCRRMRLAAAEEIDRLRAVLERCRDACLEAVLVSEPKGDDQC